MILLDTDVLSSLMKPRPPVGLIKRLQSVPGPDQSTSSITVGEIAFAAERAGRPELLARVLDLTADIKLFDFDRPAALEYGRLRAQLEAAGGRLDDPDLRIASIALANDLTLISGNVKHFGRVPDLRLEDWIRAE